MNIIIYLLISTLWSAGIAGIVSLYWLKRYRDVFDSEIDGIHSYISLVQAQIKCLHGDER